MIRTLNVIRTIPGIANNVHINVAYSPEPGRSLTDCKAFEERLEHEINAVIYSWIDRRNPYGIEFIPEADACKITSHPTAKAFQRWRERHNLKHPQAPILRRNGLIELNSLRRAIHMSGNREASL